MSQNTAYNRRKTFMPPQKPLLFTLHGINTDGPWQSGAAAVLNPFFEHYAIRYDSYRRYAVLKLATDWLIGIVLAVLGLTLFFSGFLGNWLLDLAYIVGTIAAVSAAHRYAAKLRKSVVLEVYKRITGIAGNRQPPYLIAHSFGTFLLGQLLQRFGDWSCHTVILTGCVLRCRFPWRNMTTQFKYIWNEVAGADLIPLAAGVLGLSVRDMGASGILGFGGTAVEVHDIIPQNISPNCRGKACGCSEHATHPECSARVHNVRYRQFQHSDYFEGKDHAWRAWLPTFWGYNPVLYRRFIEACQECYRLEREDALQIQQDGAAAALRGTCWGWTYGTLDDYVRRELISELRARRIDLPSADMPAFVDVVIATLWMIVSEAAAESDVRQGRRDEVLALLDPRIALKKCISAAIDTAKRR